MNPTFKKNLITNLLIVLGFAVVAMLYSFPAMQGKMLVAHDNVQWYGIAEEGQKAFKETHEPILWSNSIFGGMPSYTFFTGSSKNYVPKIVETIATIFPKPVHFMFIPMLCFFALMLVLRINRWAGAIGAVAYGLSTFYLVSISAGHDTKVLAMAYMPAVLAGFFLTFRGKYLGGAALTCVALALMTATQHVQIMYYTAMILGFAWVVLLIIALREKLVKRFAIATLVSFAAAGLAIATCLGSVMVTKEYNEYTMRGGKSELSKKQATKKPSGGLDKDYAFEYSEGQAETFTILVPDLFGGSFAEPVSRFSDNESLYSGYMGRGGGDVTVPTYWGPQRIQAGPVYFGAAICFLFLLGMLVIRSPHKWWIAAVSFLAILMSWGKNLPGLNYFLFDTLPLFNVFRTPAMILAIPQVLFPMLGVWALADIVAGRVDDQKLIKNIYIAAGVTAGLALVLGVGAGMFGDFTSLYQGSQEKQYPADLLEALKSDRAAMARNSGLLSAFFILATAGLVWLFVKKRIGMQFLMGGVALIILIDLVPVAKRYLNNAKFVDKDEYMAENFTPRAVDTEILKDPDPYYRVLDLTRDPFNDGYPAYFHKMIGGYSPAKMEIYQDLINEQMGQGFNSAVMNMLNTKYFIAGEPGREGIIPNKDACGSAWFVNEIKWVNSADSEMYSLNAPRLGDTAQSTGGFQPKQTAIVRNTFQKELGNFVPAKDSAATISLTKYGLNQLSFQSKNSQEGLAVFSDIWYPAGWTAYIDGKETPIVRANYVLRALKIPAGEHKIEFKFRPATYEKGERVAMFASLAVFALLIWAIADAVRRANKAGDDTHAGIKQG